jgi:hypothetical protein
MNYLSGKTTFGRRTKVTFHYLIQLFEKDTLWFFKHLKSNEEYPNLKENYPYLKILKASVF